MYGKKTDQLVIHIICIRGFLLLLNLLNEHKMQLLLPFLMMRKETLSSYSKSDSNLLSVLMSDSLFNQ